MRDVINSISEMKLSGFNDCSGMDMKGMIQGFLACIDSEVSCLRIWKMMTLMKIRNTEGELGTQKQV